MLASRYCFALEYKASLNFQHLSDAQAESLECWNAADSVVEHEGAVEWGALRTVPGSALWVDVASCNCIRD